MVRARIPSCAERACAYLPFRCVDNSAPLTRCHPAIVLRIDQQVHNGALDLYLEDVGDIHGYRCALLPLDALRDETAR